MTEILHNRKKKITELPLSLKYTALLVLAAFLMEWCVCGVANAQNAKVITNTRLIGVGSRDVLDTYLSNEKYKGTDFRYISHTLRQREDGRWARLIVHQGCVSTMHNRADNSNEIGGDYKFDYGLLYEWKFLEEGLSVKAGGMLDVNAGFLYNTRNSNNPAQARFNVDISPVAIATYRFTVAKIPLAINYEVSSPLCGLMFSPNYGQSYYEIFSEGNYDHNIVPTTFISNPSLRHMFTIDFNIGKTMVRIGYQGDFRQAKVNNLKYHSWSNMLVFGITRRFKIVKM